MQHLEVVVTELAAICIAFSAGLYQFTSAATSFPMIKNMTKPKVEDPPHFRQRNMVFANDADQNKSCPP